MTSMMGQSTVVDDTELECIIDQLNVQGPVQTHTELSIIHTFESVWTQTSNEMLVFQLILSAMDS